MGKRRPAWDGESLELWADRTLLKRFDRPPSLVGVVLSVFKKKRWEHCIKNPFAGKPGAKKKLRLARKMLHRYQKKIEFHCIDGSTKMTWQWRDSAPPVRPHPGT